MKHDNNGNGNGNGEEQHPLSHGQGRYPPTRSESPVAESVLDIQELTNALKELKSDFAGLTAIVAEYLKQTADAVAQAKILGVKLETALEKVVLPIAEQNRQLRDREVQFHILLPMALSIIEIIDRQYIEIPLTDQMVIQFGAIENAREIDQQELLQLLATFDIEQYAVPLGVKFDPSSHTIRETKRVDSSKVGRVLGMLRHGYRRRDWVLRPAWVVVGVSARSKQA